MKPITLANLENEIQLAKIPDNRDHPCVLVDGYFGLDGSNTIDQLICWLVEARSYLSDRDLRDLRSFVVTMRGKEDPSDWRGTDELIAKDDIRSAAIRLAETCLTNADQRCASVQGALRALREVL